MPHVDKVQIIFQTNLSLGFDTVVLSNLVLPTTQAPEQRVGKVYAYDKHPVAIEKTRVALSRDLTGFQTEHVKLEQLSHHLIPSDVVQQVWQEFVKVTNVRPS